MEYSISEILQTSDTDRFTYVVVKDGGERRSKIVVRYSPAGQLFCLLLRSPQANGLLDSISQPIHRAVVK